MRSLLITLILLSGAGCVNRAQPGVDFDLTLDDHVSRQISRQLNIDGVTEIELSMAGQLHLVAGEGDGVRIVGEEIIASQVQVSRQGDKLLIVSQDSGSLTVYLRTQTLHKLTISDNMDPSAKKGQVNRLQVTVDNHQRLKIDKINLPQVGIAMDGHGNLEVGVVVADHLTLDMRGHGKIQVNQIESALVEVFMQGHGDINLAGMTRDQRVKINGHGHYDAIELESSHAELTSRGFNLVELWVKDDLTIDARQFSSVRFRGEPTVKSLSWHHLAAAR